MGNRSILDKGEPPAGVVDTPRMLYVGDKCESAARALAALEPSGVLRAPTFVIKPTFGSGCVVGVRHGKVVVSVPCGPAGRLLGLETQLTSESEFTQLCSRVLQHAQPEYEHYGHSMPKRVVVMELLEGDKPQEVVVGPHVRKIRPATTADDLKCFVCSYRTIGITHVTSRFGLSGKAKRDTFYRADGQPIYGLSLRNSQTAATWLEGYGAALRKDNPNWTPAINPANPTLRGRGGASTSGARSSTGTAAAEPSPLLPPAQVRRAAAACDRLARTYRISFGRVDFMLGQDGTRLVFNELSLFSYSGRPYLQRELDMTLGEQCDCPVGERIRSFDLPNEMAVYEDDPMCINRMAAKNGTIVTLVGRQDWTDIVDLAAINPGVYG